MQIKRLLVERRSKRSKRRSKRKEFSIDEATEAALREMQDALTFAAQPGWAASPDSKEYKMVLELAAVSLRLDEVVHSMTQGGGDPDELEAEAAREDALHDSVRAGRRALWQEMRQHPEMIERARQRLTRDGQQIEIGVVGFKVELRDWLKRLTSIRSSLDRNHPDYPHVETFEEYIDQVIHLLEAATPKPASPSKPGSPPTPNWHSSPEGVQTVLEIAALAIFPEEAITDLIGRHTE